MSALFVNPDSLTFLSLGSAVGLACPISMIARVEPNVFPPIAGNLIGIDRTPAAGFGGFEFFRLRLNAAGQVQGSQAGPGLVSSSAFAGAYNLGSFQTAGVTFAANNSRTAYYNGVAGALDNTNVPTPTGLLDTILGASYTSTAGVFFAGYNGCGGDLAVYLSALTPAQHLAFFGGAAPDALGGGNPPPALWCKMLAAATVNVNSAGPNLVINTGAGSFQDCGAIAGGSSALVHVIGC